MCKLESNIFRKHILFRKQCVRNPFSRSCCPSWSLARYVVFLQGKLSCKDITDTDVYQVSRLLVRCAPFYRNLTLEPNCDGDSDDWYHNRQFSSVSCENVPAECTKFNAVYNILHYLTDSSFVSAAARTSSLPNSKSASLSPSSSSSTFSYSKSTLDHTTHNIPTLQYSTIFLPIVAGASSMEIFEHLNRQPKVFKDLRIIAAHFGVKISLFEKYLIIDSAWLGIACGIIFIAMWLYTTSIFITFMSLLSMFWALEVAYFIYTFVFKIHFFPYMNMVTLIVMIGIGADDLFIYCKVWHLAKAEKNNGVLEKIISDTLRHTTLSMVVTSLTTTAAFYASYISDITAIKCFSLFAGTCMLINLVLTTTWLPASVMLYEKWCRCCVDMSQRQLCLRFCLCNMPFKIYYLVCDWSRIFFEKLLPCLVIKFRFFWIFLFGALWIASLIVIFHFPKLKLPKSEEFQVFFSDHLLEKYDLEISKKFDYNHVDKEEKSIFPITIMWGVLPIDNGDFLDPHNKGTLMLDADFDLSTPAAQRWILDFCARIRRTGFVQNRPGLYVTDCFMENFVRGFMARRCQKDQEDDCCKRTPFPFDPSILISCLSTYIQVLQKDSWLHYNAKSPGPRFQNGRISAFFVQFSSNHTFSHSYEDVHKFNLMVNRWVNDELLRAPPEMRHGLFVSELKFYDLQSSLSLGTPMGVGVSLCVVSLVSFFTTLNVLVTLYALMAVVATISTTIASLVLLEWELNILESVVITLSIGLAIDLTLHYGVAYRLAPDVGRELRVISSLGCMGGPITMAAITSLLTGTFMMPSTVLVYQKFGVFLIILVSFAWAYATFFFQSLLRTWGPDGGFGQFRWPVSECCSPGSRRHVDKTIYALSESTLSTSTTSTREHSHSHGYAASSRELEPLTDCECVNHYQHHNQYRYGSKTTRSLYNHHNHQQQQLQSHQAYHRDSYSQPSSSSYQTQNPTRCPSHDHGMEAYQKTRQQNEHQFRMQLPKCISLSPNSKENFHICKSKNYHCHNRYHHHSQHQNDHRHEHHHFQRSQSAHSKADFAARKMCNSRNCHHLHHNSNKVDNSDMCTHSDKESVATSALALDLDLSPKAIPESHHSLYHPEHPLKPDDNVHIFPASSRDTMQIPPTISHNGVTELTPGKIKSCSHFSLEILEAGSGDGVTKGLNGDYSSNCVFNCDSNSNRGNSNISQSNSIGNEDIVSNMSGSKSKDMDVGDGGNISRTAIGYHSGFDDNDTANGQVCNESSSCLVFLEPVIHTTCSADTHSSHSPVSLKTDSTGLCDDIDSVDSGSGDISSSGNKTSSFVYRNSSRGSSFLLRDHDYLKMDSAGDDRATQSQNQLNFGCDSNSNNSPNSCFQFHPFSCDCDHDEGNVVIELSVDNFVGTLRCHCEGINNGAETGRTVTNQSCSHNNGSNDHKCGTVDMGNGQSDNVIKDKDCIDIKTGSVDEGKDEMEEVDSSNSNIKSDGSPTCPIHIEILPPSSPLPLLL